jgi:hypothetical protein
MPCITRLSMDYPSPGWGSWRPAIRPSSRKNACRREVVRRHPPRLPVPPVWTATGPRRYRDRHVSGSRRHDIEPEKRRRWVQTTRTGLRPAGPPSSSAPAGCGALRWSWPGCRPTPMHGPSRRSSRRTGRSPGRRGASWSGRTCATAALPLRGSAARGCRMRASCRSIAVRSPPRRSRSTACGSGCRRSW